MRVLQILVACLFGIAFVKKIRIPGAIILQYRSFDGLAFPCAVKAGRATWQRANQADRILAPKMAGSELLH